MVGFPDDADGFLKSLEEQCIAAESPRAFAPLAEAHRLAGRTDEALRVAREGLEAFPGHLGVRLVLARTLLDAGDVEGASDEYRLVLERDPANVEAAAQLGVTSSVTAAAPQEEEASLPGASLSTELSHLADLFASPTELRGGPPDAIATLTLAEIYARQGLFDRAVEVCEAILRLRPDDEEADAKLREYNEVLSSTA